MVFLGTSFWPLRPFFVCPSPLRSSFTASRAASSLVPGTSPVKLSDTRAKGEMSMAFRNGTGTVLPAAYTDLSCENNKTNTL